MLVLYPIVLLIFCYCCCGFQIFCTNFEKRKENSNTRSIIRKKTYKFRIYRHFFLLYISLDTDSSISLKDSVISCSPPEPWHSCLRLPSKVEQVRAPIYWLLRDDQAILVFIICFIHGSGWEHDIKKTFWFKLLVWLYIALANATGDPKPHKVFLYTCSIIVI